MKKVIPFKKAVIPFWLLCFTLLIPLPGTYNTANAASNVSANVNTEEKQSDIKLNVKKKTLVKDTSFSLVLYNLNDSYKVSFKSSDSSIASVDKDGVITAVDKGDTTITVTVKDGSKTVDTLTCDVTVGVPAVSITFSQASTGITLTAGKSTLLDTILVPITTVEEPVFSSKDTSIATVSSSGRITAKSVGTTYIYGTIANNQYAVITVTVVEEKGTPASTPSALPTPLLKLSRK